MAIPEVTTSATQNTSAYSLLQATALIAPYSEEKGNAVAIVTSNVTQDAASGVITVNAKITLQSYLNDGRSQVSIDTVQTPRVFKSPIPLRTIIHQVGINIYNVSHGFTKDTQGDFTLTIEGDNVLSTTAISNPFD